MCKWKVSSNYVGGKIIYQVYRRLGTSQVDHSGDREYYDGIFDTEAEADKCAFRLNSEKEYVFDG